MSRLFFRNAAFLTMVEIILKLKGFIFIPLLTRYFGTINYGVWSQVGIVVSTVTPLLILGTDSAIFKYLLEYSFNNWNSDAIFQHGWFF